MLPAGRCWIGLGSYPAGVEFSGNASGVSDHAYSLTVGYPGKDFKTVHTSHKSMGLASIERVTV